MENAFYIPKNAERNFLLKLFNNEVSPLAREFFPHRHLQFEIVVFKKGNGVYKTNHHTYDITPGDVFVFASDEVHCITEIFEGEDLEYTYIQFEPRYIMANDYRALSNGNFSFCFHHRPGFSNRLPRNFASEKIKDLILSIENEFKTQKSEYELQIRLNLFNILIILIREFNYVDEAVKNKTVYRDIVKTIMYIDENFTEDLKLKDLSKIAGLTPNYFSTVFKEVNGVSLWDYISAKRIEYALFLIDNESDKTMLEIAISCGFNNTANFNKMFKKYVGLTPMQYKKRAI